MKEYKNLKPVKDMEIGKKMTVNGLVKQMSKSGGFTSKKLAVGVDIVERMIKDKKCLKFLSFPACIISTGTRGVIKEMMKKKMFDIVMTTCGTLDHDLARIWRKYYHGKFMMDDKELLDKGINRLGNILVPNDSYGIILEEKMKKILEDIHSKGKQELASYELVWEIGKRIKDKNSIVYWSYKNKIPMIIPGPTDGSIGYQVWQYSQDHDFKLNVLKDEQFLSDSIWNAKKSGALIIGGGISKHHTIWWNQFKDGLDYVVYVTTAVEWDGSLSGAQPREAISWGKVKKEANNELIYGDATVMLPIIYASLVERL
jgi:deoxyhypusine synthase